MGQVLFHFTHGKSEALKTSEDCRVKRGETPTFGRWLQSCRQRGDDVQCKGGTGSDGEKVQTRDLGGRIHGLGD